MTFIIFSIESEKMKSPRLDLLVEFDDQTTVDLEMQLRQTKDNMMNRFPYYSSEF